MADPLPGRVIGRVAEIWRYPVKSLGGERLDRATCEVRGLDGDRRWAVLDAEGHIGSGKTTRRFRRMPGLLTLTASTDGGQQVWVTFPDGSRGRVDDPDTARRVGELVGQPVQLGTETVVSFFDDAPLHLVSTAALSQLAVEARLSEPVDCRRFRPNLVIETIETLEDGGSGRLAIGTGVRLRVAHRAARCVMVTMEQPALPFAPGLLKRLERDRGGCFGVYATVERAGPIAVGDPVRLAQT